MKLHTVFITYNRLELTKRAIESYLKTVTVPFSLSVVDNDSEDGTKEWILLELTKRQHHRSHLLAQNRYPGFATNLGWAEAPADATHLHRADNDFVFLPGWCEEVEKVFGHVKRLGQLGLRTRLEEFSSINVGGNCIVRRELWEKGLRWDERPWPQIRDEVGVGWTEDSLMSQDVKRMGWNWARVQQPCIRAISVESMDDPYYQSTWADRGIASSAT